MATTTNYSWTTPDDTALVKDGAAAIRSLGTSIDTTTKALNPSTTLGDIEYRSSTANTNTRLGIGTTGQILTVSGGVPAWANAPADVPLSTFTTNGDLIYGTGAGTVTRRGIGTSGQVLTVSGGVPTWVTPSSGGVTNATATVSTAQSTTSASYTDLATVGPAVTLTTGTKALVIVSTWVDGTANIDFAVSGATTRSASDATSLQSSNVAPFRLTMARIVTVTAGSNTFTMRYKSQSGTSTFQDRQISVIDMGS